MTPLELADEARRAARALEDALGTGDVAGVRQAAQDLITVGRRSLDETD